MTSSPAIIALFGPTAVGKTDLAVALARRVREQGGDPVAVSADALQVYRGLETLTGVPSAKQRRELEHRLVSFLSVTQTFSVAQYMRMAHGEIDALLAAGRTVLVVGGTGLYLRAALADLDLRPAPPGALRAHWVAELDRRGGPALHLELAGRAPHAAAAIDPHDRQRVVRALELADMAALDPRPGRSQLWTAATRHPTLLVGLVCDRDLLHDRIAARVRAMVLAGAEQEVRQADAAGASVTARAALGFTELLRGDEQAMVTRTRRYAKRQLTWMRKLAGVQLLDVSAAAPDEVARSLDIIGSVRGAGAGQATAPPATRTTGDPT